MDNLERALFAVPVLLFSMVAHEYAHGYAALKQGDATAYQLGRLTLNPLKHIDPVMTIVLPLMLLVAGGPMIGGAKPVPVNPRNYRRYRSGDIIVSLAGIATNIVIAFLAALVIAAIGLVGRGAGGQVADTLGILQVMGYFAIAINLQLAAFNLLPVPPLDGSHVMKYLLPPAWSIRYQRVGFFGIFILILLLNTRLIAWWLTPSIYLTDVLVRAVERAGLFLPAAAHWFS